MKIGHGVRNRDAKEAIQLQQNHHRCQETKVVRRQVASTQFVCQTEHSTAMCVCSTLQTHIEKNIVQFRAHKNTVCVMGLKGPLHEQQSAIVEADH